MADVARRNIHPFPAKMAPELALEALDRLKPGSRILDPMCGSGTVLKNAIEGGHSAMGFDLDPLAVLISRVTCRTLRADRVLDAAESLVVSARRARRVRLPWIDSDPETRTFTQYWFATEQRRDLRRLAWALTDLSGPTSDALRLALSRTIITKDRGASLARDVSHSRPHRVRDENDFDVYRGFLNAATHIADLVERTDPGSARVAFGDARRLPANLDRSFDLILTSPPYLNAIDYMRGHRMSLVWLGYRLRELRATRSTAVGAERRVDDTSASPPLRGYKNLSSRQRGMLERYAVDMDLFCKQLERKVLPGGEVVIVVGDSTLGGTYIRNSTIVRGAAQRAGLELISRRSRELPAASRYLPPPSDADNSTLAGRMRHEVVLRFAAPPSGGKDGKRRSGAFA